MKEKGIGNLVGSRFVAYAVAVILFVLILISISMPAFSNEGKGCYMTYNQWLKTKEHFEKLLEQNIEDFQNTFNRGRRNTGRRGQQDVTLPRPGSLGIFDPVNGYYDDIYGDLFRIDPHRRPARPGGRSRESILAELKELEKYYKRCFIDDQEEEKEEEGVKKEEEEERREGIGPPSPVSYRLYAGKLELFEGHGALVGILLFSPGAVDSTPQNLEVLNYSEDLYVKDILPFGEFEKFALTETSEGHSAAGTVEIEILPNGVQIKYDLSTEGSPTETYVTIGGVYTGCTLAGGLVPAVYALEVEYWPDEGGRRRDVIIEIEEDISASGTGEGEFEVLVNVHHISSLSVCPTGPDFLSLEPVNPGRSVLIDGRDASDSDRFMVEFMVFGRVLASARLSTTHAPDEFGEASGVLFIRIYDELSDEDQDDLLSRRYIE